MAKTHHSISASTLFLTTVLLWTAYAIDNAYQTTLVSLCDALLATQITDKTNANYGALVCPSKNPDINKIHSRAAEAVYPLAVEYKLTGQTKYRDAAIILGNWLIKLQETTGKVGGWSEDWPDPSQTGWYGTTADQLISLAGAYPIVKQSLTAAESTAWNNAIGRAADYVRGSFPVSNVNYNAIGGAALWLASSVVSNPKIAWTLKADTLVRRNTLDSIGTDNLLYGEGKGVDQGYDMAQSIGYTALYATFTNNTTIKQRAVDMLHSHYDFVYPNGSVDNSWGTRSFKWGYESGTKTAPGVYFSFALLADADPSFNAAGLACLNYLRTKCLDSGRVTYGPHAKNHSSSSPPCNYQTFARAQSLALAIEYGPQTTDLAPFPAQKPNWYKFFNAIKVVVVRTKNIMATVSAYGEIRTYSRNTVPKGGSACNVWYEGFGENGYLQTSSATVYTRTEDMHMPIETSPVPLPLTPRIETTIQGVYYTNLFETLGTMSVSQASDNVSVTTTGKLVSQSGTNSASSFSLTNRFYDSMVKKEITVSGATASFSIIEPFVKDKGTAFAKSGSNSVTIKPANGLAWTLHVDSATTVPFTITLGTDSARYWCPFPGIEAYPVIVSFATTGTGPQTIVLTINGPQPTDIRSRSACIAKQELLALQSRPTPSGDIGIRYCLPAEGHAFLAVYSLSGKLVAVLCKGEASGGTHAFVWNVSGTPRGMYLCTLTWKNRVVSSTVIR